MTMAQLMYYAMYTGTAPARADTSHAKIAPYATFRTGAGGEGAEQWRVARPDRGWPSSGTPPRRSLRCTKLGPCDAELAR